jgi:hypothetical protein
VEENTLRMKKYLYIIGILFAFLLCSCVYFHDAFFGNLIAYGDAIALQFPMYYLVRMILSEGALPLWNPYIFSGTPLLGTLDFGVLYPLNLLQHIFPSPFSAFNFGIIVHYALAGLFTFMYTRLIGARPLPSFLAGIVFSYLGFLKANLSHAPIISSGVWLPLMLYFIEKLRRGAGFKHAAALAFAVGLSTLAGSAQITLYASLTALLYVCYFSFKVEKGQRARFLLLSFCGFFLGIVVALPHLVSGAEFLVRSVRRDISYEFFTAYKLLPSMIPTMVFPRIFTDPHGLYWGPDASMKSIGMIGSTLPLLLSLAVIVKRGKANPHVAFWGVAAATFVLLSLYTPLQKLMFHVPIYNLFRVQERNLFQVDFALSVLTALGLTHILQDRKGARALAVPFAAGTALIAAATLAALLLKARLVFLLELLDFLEPARALSPGVLSIRNPAIFVPLLFLALYTLWMVAAGWFRKPVLGIILLALVAGEAAYYRPASPMGHDISLLRTVMRDMQFLNYVHSDRPNRIAFYEDASRHAVGSRLPLPPNFPALRKISMIDGYMPLLVDEYSHLLDIRQAGVTPAWKALMQNNLLLSMLNAKYLIIHESDREKTRIIGGLDEFYRHVFTDSGYSVYLNVRSLPRAYAVEEILPSRDIDTVKTRLYEKSIDPRMQAFLRPEDIRKIGESSFSPASVSMSEYGSDRVELVSSSEGAAFVVLADQYYPGWQASIDGTRTDIFRTNGVLRGVVVPPGKHTIVFAYRPSGIYVSMVIGVLTALGLGGALVIMWFRGRKRRPPRFHA